MALKEQVLTGLALRDSMSMAYAGGASVGCDPRGSSGDRLRGEGHPGSRGVAPELSTSGP
jgi:hypothetical protein